MVIERTMPACEVQAGVFRDPQATWEILRVEINRDGTRTFVQCHARPAVGQKRRGGRWRAPAIAPDALVTVYEKVSPEG